MGALGQLRQAFEVAGRAVGFASRTQGGARRELVDSLEQVASKCDDAYTQVRTALRPVRESYRDPVQLGPHPFERTPDLPGWSWLKGVPHGATSPAVLAGVQA